MNLNVPISNIPNLTIDQAGTGALQNPRGLADAEEPECLAVRTRFQQNAAVLDGRFNACNIRFNIKYECML